MKKSTSSVLLIAGIFLLSWAGKGAAEPARTVLGWADLRAVSALGFDLDMSIGDHYFGLVPELRLQYGTRVEALDIAAGARFGFAAFFPEGDGPETGAWPSALAFELRINRCYRGTIKICFGTDTRFSINAWEPDSAGQGSGMMTGWINEQMRFDTYPPKILGITPLLGLQGAVRKFFFQFSLGPSLFIMLDEAYGDDVEAALLWSIDLGLEMDFLRVGMAFKGNSTLSFPGQETYFALDFAIHLLQGHTRPYMRFSVPLSGDLYQDALNLVLTLGVAVDL